MKKIVYLSALALFIVACSKVKDGEYIVNGTAKGIQDGKKVTVKMQNETGITVNLDSTKIKNGKFEIKGKFKEPAMYAVFIEGLMQPVPFIVENDEIKIAVDKDSVWKSKIGGTHYNDEFQKFNEKSNVINKKLLDFQNKNMQKFMAAQQSQDTATMNKLKKDYDVIAKELKDYYDSYAEKNSDSYISLLLLQGQFNSPDFKYETVKKTFDNLDSELKKTSVAKTIEQKLKNIAKNKNATVAPKK